MITNTNKDNFKIYSNYCPMIAHAENETDDQFEKRWSHFDVLPEPLKDKLSDKKTEETIKNIQDFFALSINQINFISRAIRSYYFGELKLEDMPFVLAKEIGVDLTKAKEITQNIITKIINDDSQEKAYQASLENLLIPEALKKYPELGEQLITENRIKIKSFPEPARPSLKNWLADYVMLLGREKHGAVERGNYLFQSENGKNLSSVDRQRMNYLLKCLDENTPITINKTTKQIVFPKISENTPGLSPNFVQSAQAPLEPKSNIQSIQFSYPQKTLAPRPASPIILPKQENKNNLGPNVVNLKEQ